MSAPLAPSADDARELLRRELAKAEYQNSKPGLLDRLAQQFWDWVSSIRIGSVDGAPIVATVAILVIVAVVVLVAFRVYGRPRLNRRATGPSSLFGADDRRSADELRAAAARAAASGDAALAVAEAFRGLARGLDERDLVVVSPGTTAHTVASRAADRFPSSADALASASDSFDGVRYLERTVTLADYERVRDRDRALERTTPAPPATDAVAGARPGVPA